MQVRINKDGELVAAGSINHSELARLQAAHKRRKAPKSDKSEDKSEGKSEGKSESGRAESDAPKAAPRPEPKPRTPRPE